MPGRSTIATATSLLPATGTATLTSPPYGYQSDICLVTLFDHVRNRIPSHEDGGQNLPTGLNHGVYLCHPGYSETGNILMVLSALDHPQGGIHHETARIACAIVANNNGRVS
ncbi:uncharacterized protein K441DRAFT_149797 [Cenococcum geophilum 1.58]|uniref:uncharacterized protein n=1 Tax=Cenococcum geophilum 1.58 TaxID=794803 RepID=UPI00358F88B6|nr:hypothetical protein K441DRAFT_149797 [Cenococcum geophilum 1.58]